LGFVIENEMNITHKSLALFNPISLLSCQNLVTSIYAENNFLIAHKTDNSYAHCVKNRKPIRIGLKIIILKSKPRIPLIYKKIESPFLTFRPEQKTDIAHEESSFSVQTNSYVFQ